MVTELGIQQVFTRRNHPQTNGEAERLNGLVRQEALRPASPDSYREAWQTIHEYAYHYNRQRLHSAIGFLRPADVFFDRAAQILAAQKQKLTKPRLQRKTANCLRRDLYTGRREAEPALAHAPARG